MATDKEFFQQALQSLRWEYEGGSHDYRLQHDTSTWRLLPFLVVVCTVEGEYIAGIEGKGMHKAVPGETLLVPAGVRHTVAIPNSSTVHHAHIQFSVFNTLDVLSLFKVPLVVGGSTGREMALITSELHQIISAPTGGHQAMHKAIRAQQAAFSLLLRIVSASVPAETSLDRLEAIVRLGPILRRIDQDLALPINRSQLASLACLSESRFHEVFLDAMHMSPMAYVRHVRMRQAQRLLADPLLRIGEVGTRVGYPDGFHFSKVFKAETGISPTGYRQGLRRWLANGRA